MKVNIEATQRERKRESQILVDQWEEGTMACLCHCPCRYVGYLQKLSFFCKLFCDWCTCSTLYTFSYGLLFDTTSFMIKKSNDKALLFVYERKRLLRTKNSSFLSSFVCRSNIDSKYSKQRKTSLKWVWNRICVLLRICTNCYHLRLVIYQYVTLDASKSRVVISSHETSVRWSVPMSLVCTWIKRKTTQTYRRPSHW